MAAPSEVVAAVVLMGATMVVVERVVVSLEAKMVVATAVVATAKAATGEVLVAAQEGMTEVGQGGGAMGHMMSQTV